MEFSVICIGHCNLHGILIFGLENVIVLHVSSGNDKIAVGKNEKERNLRSFGRNRARVNCGGKITMNATSGVYL